MPIPKVIWFPSVLRHPPILCPSTSGRDERWTSNSWHCIFSVLDQRVVDYVWGAKDLNLWKDINEEINKVYLSPKPMMPKKKSMSTIDIAERVTDFLKKNTRLLCEVSSCDALICHHTESDPNEVFRKHDNIRQPKTSKTLMEVNALLSTIRHLAEKCHLVLRDVATDVFVFVLSDLHREKSVEHVLTGFPIYYGFSGKCLPMTTVRKLSDHLVQYCKSEGIDVITRGFDGQMAKLAYYDNSGKSLTMLHAQKQHYSDCKRMGKDALTRGILERVSLETPRSEQMEHDQCVLFVDDEYSEHTKATLREVNNLIVEAIESLKQILSPLCCKNVDTSSVVKSLVCFLKKTTKQKDTNDPDEVQEENIMVQNSDNDDDDGMQRLLAEIESEMVLEGQEGATGGDTDVDDDVTVLYNDSSVDALTDEAPVPVTEHENTCNQTMINALNTALREIRSHSEKLELQWRDIDANTLLGMCKDAESIDRAMSLEVLKLLTKSLKSQGYMKGKINLKNKADFINSISEEIGDGSVSSRKPSVTQISDMTARDLFMSRRVSKQTLSILYAILSWQESLSTWMNTGLIQNGMQILYESSSGNTRICQEQVHWFSQPEVCADGKPLFTIIDPHHLFVNSRCHVCNTGYKQAGISNYAWKKVARDSKHNGTHLNPSMVETPVIDTQSGATAELVFSEAVELCLRENGDIEEANFCNLLRNWHAAFDKRGIADGRVMALLKMRDWLLGLLLESLMTFPPTTGYVKSIPVTTFLGILISCERAIQLHRFVIGGSYNYRGLGSNMNETFFASFRDLDPKGTGVLRPDDFPRAMSISCTLLQTRLNKTT